jgi:hypothetical protein
LLGVINSPGYTFNICVLLCSHAAAVAVAFKSPPIIKYRLDFGAVPSTVTSVREQQQQQQQQQRP